MELRKRHRFIELDVLRGMAIISMVIFHFLFDLSYFGVRKLDLFSGWWIPFSLMAQFTFLSLVGISLHLSSKRAFLQGKTSQEFNKKIILRGFKILGCGMVITLVTWIFVPYEFVKFGILHLIGTFVIISPLFLSNRKIIFITFPIVLSLWFIFKSITISHNTWFIFGLHSNNFYSLDYFPLIPWMIIPLLGILIGQTVYKEYRSRVEKFNIFNALPFKLLAVIGQKSLLIYLLHQPILIGITFLIFKK